MRMARVDENQKAIVIALRRLGASVQSLATVGKGCPDLIVGFRGVNYLLECKNDSKVKSQRQLTPCQVDWHGSWVGAPVGVVENIDQAIAYISN